VNEGSLQRQGKKGEKLGLSRKLQTDTSDARLRSILEFALAIDIFPGNAAGRQTCFKSTTMMLEICIV
jgi:hypothetical protein